MNKMITNPLRISSESLNLDDIISDLNTGVDNYPMMPAKSKDQKQLDQKASKSNTSTMAVIGTKASNAALKKKETKPTSVSQKENNNTQNKVQSGVKKETDVVPKKQDFLISTTTAANESAGQYSSTSQHPSQRYASETNFETEQEPISSIQNSAQKSSIMADAPFYLNNPQKMMPGLASLTDEDVEQFQRRLDTMIINFRSETLGEFMRTKKQLLIDQAASIDAERRRSNTMLTVKQNEIENLKEQLANKTKESDEMRTRSEVLALWAGEAKTKLRIKLLQKQAFDGLKEYRDFKKHSNKVLEHKIRQNKEDLKRKAFSGWEKQYKEWKVVKNKDDFEKAVKLELQSICAQYNKEIESLRQKLDEANAIVDQEMKNKALIQENLKKAFMRGVCALNFEAMSILTPDQSGYQSQIEREMEKQVMSVFNGLSNQPQQLSSSQTPNMYSESSAQKNMNFGGNRQFESMAHMPTYQNNFDNQSQYSDHMSERKFMQMEPDMDSYKKIETKDSQWKPAPIMGRDFTQQPQPQFTYQQPTITSNLRPNITQQQQPNFVLPSQFMMKSNDQQQLPMPESLPQVRVVHEDTQSRTQVVEPAIIQASSLPDFVSSQQQPVSEGKMIYANVAQVKSTPSQKSTSITGKKPTTQSSVVTKKK